MSFECKTVETDDLLHVLVEFKTLLVLQLFCRRSLIHELFLKVIIVKVVNIISFCQNVSKKNNGKFMSVLDGLRQK